MRLSNIPFDAINIQMLTHRDTDGSGRDDTYYASKHENEGYHCKIDLSACTRQHSMSPNTIAGTLTL